MASKKNNPLHNFYEHTYITHNCWLWLGSIDKDGYGVFTIKQKKTPAHRTSWLLHNGDIKDGHYILHTCHNPSCVNSEHLKQGTQYDNIQDQIKLGTNVAVNKLSAKLNPDKVRYIRQSTKNYRDLAVDLNVSHYCVWDVLHKRSWNDVT